ncbi:hypothetical protein E9993_19260 [Labilibacter sediminis]|nr:hypothetical protein E9993_19260 [Labilibacter sediminis]
MKRPLLSPSRGLFHYINAKVSSIQFASSYKNNKFVEVYLLHHSLTFPYMKHIYLLIFFQLMSLLWAQAEITDGIPFSTHYSDKDYEVSNNNWDIIQDSRGIMYFANEYGILEFDGNKWEIIQIASNRSNIKSLAIDNKGRLYAGAQGDFGYLDYWQPYGLHFISLTPKIPQECRDFGDVNDIIIKNDQVIFNTWHEIFVYSNDSIQVFKTDNRIKGVFDINDKIIVQDNSAFYELNSGGLIPIAGGEQFSNMDIRFMLPFKDNSVLVGTNSHGLFILKDNVAIEHQVKAGFSFVDNKIINGHLRKNGDYAIGTVGNGICFLNKHGELVYHLSKDRGIQNNEIRALFSDQNDNFWVANKKGIDFVELASPFSLVIPNPDEPLGVYSAAEYNNKLFFATHNGLLETDLKGLIKSPLVNLKFKKRPDLPDLNWNLFNVNGVLVIAHAHGFSQIVGEQQFPLYDEDDGGWVITPLPNNPDYLLGGTYSGLILLKKEGAKFKFIRKIEGFEESCRVIEVDQQNNIWIAHGYKGIFRLRLSDDLSTVVTKSFYDNQKGLPTNVYNSVFKIWGEIVFGTQYGFYKYDMLNDSIVLNKEFTGLLGYGHGRKLQEDSEGNVWFITGEESGIINKHANGSVSVQKDPFLKLNEYYIPGFEHFYFVDSNSTIIGTKDGVVTYNKNKINYSHTKNSVLLREVIGLRDKKEVYNDRFQFLCDTLYNEYYEFPFRDNSLQFSFASPDYESVEDIKYKFFLQGFDRDWSEWTSEQYKDYTNLREGEYLFRVKAKNIHNSVSEEKTFGFEVLPPWYRSPISYALYALVIIFSFSMFLKIRNVKVIREKERYIKEQARLRELEQAHFNEEKLENELAIKNQELSGLAMKVIYKNEKLTELKEKVSTIMGIASDRVAKRLSNLLNFIDIELDDDNWDDFELRFDQAHNNFIKKLKAEFPELTSKDLKICAYLRMNLSSKEIANLLNMTVRGVENARYRVRKRMNLDASVNLTEWLLVRK